jgi:hypothetical protein
MRIRTTAFLLIIGIITALSACDTMNRSRSGADTQPTQERPNEGGGGGGY